jgi:poly(A) polymerase
LNPPSAPDSAPVPLARIIPRSDHTVSRSGVAPNALRVLYRLKDAGYQAFLVGGCVRDLIVGISPKDFDVATNALPEEVKRLFRNSRLIGRRFRLAHVFFGREIIEVATFRASTAPSQAEEPVPDLDDDELPLSVVALEDDEESEVDDGVSVGVLDEEDDDDEDGEDEGDEGEDDADADPDADSEAEVGDDRDLAEDDLVEPARTATRSGALDPGDRARAPGNAGGRPRDRSAPEDDGDPDRMLDETGRIIRDNVYGSVDDDVWRRDFTANALYYNIADFSIWDYVGGFEDIAARRLRMIGDPETRYREDPVRMLRAARFEAKLGFALDPATEEPMQELRGLLADVPPARLFDETMKLFLTGHGAASLRVLRRHGLLEILLPNVDHYLVSHPGSLVEQLLVRGLENTDERVHAGRPVTPTFLFSILLYGPIAAAIESLPPSRWHESSAILDGCDLAVREVQGRISIPRRFSLGVREMFAMQPRLEQRRGRRSLRLLEHPRFRAGYDLLLLRAEFGMAPSEIATWWTRLQEVDVEERGRMADETANDGGRSGGGGGGGGGGSGSGGPRRGPRRRRGSRRPSH